MKQTLGLVLTYAWSRLKFLSLACKVSIEILDEHGQRGVYCTSNEEGDAKN